LWFRLLDLFAKPLRDLTDRIRVRHGQRINSVLSDVDITGANPSPNKKGRSKWTVAERMHSALNALLTTVMNAMMTHVPFDVIISRMGSEYGQNEFGEFRPMIVTMMETYSYEVAILQTAKKIWNRDLFRRVQDLQKLRCKGVHPKSDRCGSCGLAIGDAGVGRPDTLWLFLCGHCFHSRCVNSAQTSVCPICQNERFVGTHTRSRTASQVPAKGLTSVGSLADAVEPSNPVQPESGARLTGKYVKRLDRLAEATKATKSTYDIFRELQASQGNPFADGDSGNPFNNAKKPKTVLEANPWG
jgi:hypothetical protein